MLVEKQRNQYPEEWLDLGEQVILRLVILTGFTLVLIKA